MRIVGLIVLWVVLGLPGTGMMLAHCQQKWPGLAVNDCREDAGVAYGGAVLFGPMWTGMTFFLTGFGEYGMQFTCKGK